MEFENAYRRLQDTLEPRERTIKQEAILACMEKYVRVLSELERDLGNTKS